MTQYDFGQPVDGIIQIAYTVPDIRAAMIRYTERLDVGPWFFLEHFSGIGMQYRGAPTAVDISLALAYHGHIQFELIQQHNDVPSVYRDRIDKAGFGFHHWGIGTEAFDRDIQRHVDRGYAMSFTALMPAGNRVAYMDSSVDLPGMIELIEMNPATEKLFTSIYAASVGWDGRDPVRAIG